MKIFNQKKDNILSCLNNLIKSRIESTSETIDSIAKKIINEVKQRGDEALIEFVKKYDKILINKSQILIPEQIRNNYKGEINKNIIKSFEIAIQNITSFHKRQLPQNYEINKDDIVIGSMWKPIEAVGLYVPGGSASYPSSLLMNVIPALVAGVKRVVVTTPSMKGKFNPYLMALLDILILRKFINWVVLKQ